MKAISIALTLNSGGRIAGKNAVGKSKTPNLWGLIIGLVVVVYCLRQDATTAPAPVDLGTAATFGILAATTVTTIPTTTVNGDLGVSPGTTVTGSPVVNGMVFTNTPGPAATAQSDLTTAYNDAAGRTVDAITVSGNIGGQTLSPGLYKSATSLEISAGDLTLDALGDTNAVWIFQIGTTLITTVGRQVILSGGAQAANIFWQVGSSATIGASSVFKGHILAYTSIAMNTGATLEGSALARKGAVSLDANTITVPNTASATVILESASMVTGPYTDAAGQSLDLSIKTITAPLLPSTTFYRLRSNTSTTITSISLSGSNVVITYN